MTKKQINSMTIWATVTSIAIVLIGIGLGVYGFINQNNIIGSIGIGMMALFSLERLRLALSMIRQQHEVTMQMCGFLNEKQDKKIRDFDRRGA